MNLLEGLLHQSWHLGGRIVKKGHFVDLSCCDCLWVIPLALNILSVAKSWEFLGKGYCPHLAFFVIELLPSYYLFMRSHWEFSTIEVIVYWILDQLTIAVYSVANVEQLVYWIYNWNHLAQLRGTHRWTLRALSGTRFRLLSVKQMLIPLLILPHDVIVKLLRELDFADVFIEHINCLAYLFSDGLI